MTTFSTGRVPYERREFIRLQLEGENDEQTPGDVYEGIREAVTQGREFIGSTVAGSMPQALQCRQPLLRSLQIANLPETRPIPHPPSPS